VSASPRWTNPSVIRFSGEEDPVKLIVRKASTVVIDAMDAGWSGPPFDPVALADFLGIGVVPKDDVADARTVPVGPGFRIEFNPNRPKGRVRYSIAHEIAHTLFPDCAKRVRNRVAHEGLTQEDRELEALCNIAAAEFLMPMGSFPVLTGHDLAMGPLSELRRTFEVSMEAVFIRAVQLTSNSCAAFCCSRNETRSRYVIDYMIPSQSWTKVVVRGATVPLHSVVEECTSIGYTARGIENWTPMLRGITVECMGIPSYPGASVPRVVGILSEDSASTPSMVFVAGDAIKLRRGGKHIIAHVVNHQTPTWGGRGFARALRNRWPTVQNDFRAWAKSTPSRLTLGNAHATPVDDNNVVFSMIAQRGYGASDAPRVQYKVLERCLQRLADVAVQSGAIVHMPRIGTGHGGGSWEVIEELVRRTLCSRGLQVRVYTLPQATGHRPPA
jgi:O-acetyl-ADP-ribose deacetylase (regulator of RNase III)